MTQNGQFHLICNFSNLFPPKWLRMTRNGQFCVIHNFSNFFPPKWLRITRNGQFCMAKIKYTLIQGNFYERLLFYMDSCALSPMASLLCKCTISCLECNDPHSHLWLLELGIKLGICHLGVKHEMIMQLSGSVAIRLNFLSARTSSVNEVKDDKMFC